jgi:hypothetical protein
VRNFSWLRRIFLVLLATIFSTTTVVAAPARTQKQTPLPITMGLPLMQKFANFKEYFRFADTVNPGKGYDKWADAVDKSGLSKNVPLNSLRAEGMKLFVPQLPEPFVFSNDGKTVSYKGIGVEFKAGMTVPEPMPG